MRELALREKDGGETAESDGVHAAEVGVLLPYGIAVGEDGAGERAGEHEGGEDGDGGWFAAAQEAAKDGES